MFIEGTWITLYIAVVGTILGFVLGFLIGVIQDSKISQHDNPVKKVLMRFLKGISTVYVEVFRDTPMIVQAMIIYYGLRQTSFGAHMTAVFAGILVTVLNTGAYMAETVRGGIGSIDKGQREGAWAMGMSPIKTMCYVVLPQAFKNIIPEMANTFLTNLKMTSVLNVIAVKFRSCLWQLRQLVEITISILNHTWLLRLYILSCVLSLISFSILWKRRWQIRQIMFWQLNILMMVTNRRYTWQRKL